MSRSPDRRITLLDGAGGLVLLVGIAMLFRAVPDLEPGLRIQWAVVLMLAGLAAIGGPRVLREFFRN